jgi:hypothetical protein
MKRRRSLLLAAIPALLVGTVVITTSSPAPAAPAAPAQAPPLQVVASGLDHPRGLVAGPFGIVLIAESGEEGVAPCLPPSPGTGNKPACFSATGAITLAWGGRTFRLLDQRASNGAEDGTASSGPHDLAATSDGLRILYGYANNPELRPGLGEAAATLGTLTTVDFRGRERIAGDLAEHERVNNPGGEPGFAGLWSNPYSMIPDGHDVLVSDSGANAILRVTPAGQVTTVAVLPSRQVPLPTGGTITMESVPTGMVRGGDGAVYVGELTGAPFPVGGARVFRVVPGQAPQVVATGFTNVIDVAFDRQGRLLVLEHATNGLPSGDPTGALKRVEANGSTTTLVSTGLVSPTALTVAPDGAVLISNKGTSVDGGEVVRFVPPA